MSDDKTTSIEFEDENPVAEEIRTDINPQEISQNPVAHAEKMAAQRASDFDQMSGFSVPRDFVMLPSKGMIYSPDSPLHNTEELEVRHLTAADEDILTSRALLCSGIVMICSLGQANLPSTLTTLYQNNEGIKR